MNANKKHLALNVALVLASLSASQHLAAQPRTIGINLAFNFQ